MGLLVHPDMVLLDLVGPQTGFLLLMAKVHLVWKDRPPVTTDVGIAIDPTTTFADCPEALDVLFVPGGLKGSVACMVQLVIEYDPKPPFDSGSPEGVGAARGDDIRRRRAPLLTAAEQAACRAKSRLGT